LSARVATAAACALLWAREARPIASGGIFGGAARASAAAGYWNPAAVGELGDAWSALVELQGIAFQARFERAGTDPNTGQAYPGVGFFSPAPSLDFTLVAPTPLPWLRFIVSGFSPLALAVDWPQDGPNRYHATNSMVLAYGIPVGVVVQPSRRWALSAGAGPMYGLLRSAYSIDFGAFANGQMTPGSQPLPLEDPQLEGRVTLSADGWNVLAMAGAWAQPFDSLRVGVGLAWPFGMTLRGRAAVKTSPSLEQALPGFKLDAAGNLAVDYRMAGQIQGEVEWIPGDWSFALIAQDWFAGVRAAVPARITDANVSFLNGDQLSVGDTRDEPMAGLRVSRRLDEDWEVGVRADFSRCAVPQEAMNPGNMSYNLLAFSAGARWRFSGRNILELGYMFVQGLDVRVGNSVFDPYAPPNSGLAAPSANGLYQARGHMLTLSLLAAGAEADDEP